MRLLNRLLAALLSLALIAAGVLLIIEVVADRINHRPAVVKWHGAYDWANRTAWTNSAVRVVAIGLLIVGLILLVAELKRPRIRRLPIAIDSVDAAYTRRGVGAAVRSAVLDVDGIRSARVVVRRHSVRVAATTTARERSAAQGFQAPAHQAAEARLAELRLRSTPSLSLTTRPRSG